MDYIILNKYHFIDKWYFFCYIIFGDFMNFKRVLLKLSGEALKNNKDGIIDLNYVKEICLKIKKLYSLN